MIQYDAQIGGDASEMMARPIKGKKRSRSWPPVAVPVQRRVYSTAECRR